MQPIVQHATWARLGSKQLHGSVKQHQVVVRFSWLGCLVCYTCIDHHQWLTLYISSFKLVCTGSVYTHYTRVCYMSQRCAKMCTAGHPMLQQEYAGVRLHQLFGTQPWWPLAKWYTESRKPVTCLSLAAGMLSNKQMSEFTNEPCHICLSRPSTLYKQLHELGYVRCLSCVHVCAVHTDLLLTSTS